MPDRIDEVRELAEFDAIRDRMNERQVIALERIAHALETIARGSEPEEPNLVKPIGEYTRFDWPSIGATVVQTDPDGPTHVEYGGFLWMRRSPKNKYEPAIWFSRPAGKDAEGTVNYLRLITFRKIGEADPLPEKASELVKKPKLAPEPETKKVTEKVTEKADPSKPNGKRPYTPEQLRIRLGEIQATHIGKTASEAQRQLAVMLLEKCWAGESDATDKRHTVQNYLFGVPSIKDVFDTFVLACLDWLHPTKDSGGDYQVDPNALMEARQVFRAALKSEGQQELL